MKKLDWNILLNHLTGTSSEKEERELSTWLSASEEHRVLYERIRALWLAEPKPSRRPDTEKALQNVLSRIRQPHPSSQSDSTRVIGTISSRKPARLVTAFSLWRIAAVLVVALGTFFLYRLFETDREFANTSVTFRSMQSLRLPDSTKVTFDVGSSFTYPTSFGASGKREVYLNGEAYFEVARDEKHPFIIHANGGRIEVLGTKFDVRAWGADNHVTVAVQEGRVSFQPEGNSDTSHMVILGANNMSSLVHGSSPTSPEFIEMSGILSWMKKEIYFRNAPVPEVLHQLERWYGVSITSSDSSFLNSSMTVFIENKPLADNLNLLDVTMNMRHEQAGTTVRFLPK